MRQSDSIPEAVDLPALLPLQVAAGIRRVDHHGIGVRGVVRRVLALLSLDFAVGTPSLLASTLRLHAGLGNHSSES